MDTTFRYLQRKSRIDPTPEAKRKLRHHYYKMQADDILWAQKPRGYLYHAWDYTFYPNNYFTATALCDSIGSGSLVRLAISLRRLADTFCNNQELYRCKRCERKIAKGTTALTVGEAHSRALDREFL